MKVSQRDRQVLRNMTNQVEDLVSLEQRIKGYKQIAKRKNAQKEHRIGARISIWQAEEQLEKLVDEMKHENV